MSTSEMVAGIAGDQSLSVRERVDRIALELSPSADRGLGAVVECLLETDDERISGFAAQYLALLPGAAPEKTRVAQRLQSSGLPIVRSAARLVPWLSDDVLRDFVGDYLQNPEKGSPLSSVAFNVAAYAPELLRPFAEGIENRSIHRGLLSGAPDELVDAFCEKWRREGGVEDTALLESLALIRTSHAAEVIASVRDEVEDSHEWERLLSLSGRLPDSDRSAGFRPALMGSVTGAGESPHVMGGSLGKNMPICLSCSAATERVLTLSAADLPFALSADPSFFWYTCDCGILDSVTVRLTSEGIEVYHGERGNSDPERRIVPGDLSLTLEPHRNQAGISMRATAGQSRHQVGGLPQWIRIEAHPHCPECEKSMPFLASVDSGPTPYGHMGFTGTLYGFWCDDCQVSVTEFQV
jgi:hypothetical protein